MAPMTPALSPTPEQIARIEKMVETAPHWAKTPQHRADIDALRSCLAAVARLRAVENALLNMIDFPTAWAICRATKVEQHHERCSYRQAEGGILCDCAGLDAAQAYRKHVLALLRAGTPEVT